MQQSHTTHAHSADRPPVLVYGRMDQSLGTYLGGGTRKLPEQEFEAKQVPRQVVSDILTVTLSGQSPVEVPRGAEVVVRQPVLVTFRTNAGGSSNKQQSDIKVCARWFVLVRIDPHTTCVLYRESSKWTTLGARLLSTNRTHVQCAYDRLAHFAVLMDVNNVRISATHQYTLAWITVIGCCIRYDVRRPAGITLINCSALCLFAAIVVVLMFNIGGVSQMHSREMIHLHLCITLLCGEILFLVGMLQTGMQLMCTVIAVLLHYTFLSAFMWMLLEGFELYLQLVRLVPAGAERRLPYCITGYGRARTYTRVHTRICEQVCHSLSSRLRSSPHRSTRTAQETIAGYALTIWPYSRLSFPCASCVVYVLTTK
jgi:hypothetical protein